MRLSSDALAEYALSVDYDRLPDAVLEQVRRLTLDSAGCCLGAYEAPPVEGLRSIYGDRPASDGGATVIGSGAETAVEYAALINATMVRYLDYNDTYMGKRSGCHPSDHLPALLSVAEAEGATGPELVEAVVVAYELEGAGLDTGAIWETTEFDYVTWGAYSSAAAVGSLMGLERDELADAIGIAGTANAPLSIARRDEVSAWKGIAHAYVTHNAVQACGMARAGVTGPPRVFEGDGGVFAALGDEVEFDAMGGRDGAPYRILRTNYKPFATGYWMQSGVSAVLDLVDEHGLEPGGIDSITVEMWDEAVRLLADPEKWSTDLTRETADHSVPYTVAVAIVDGEVTPAQFAPDRLDDGRVHELMGKVEVEESEAMTRHRREHPSHIPSVVTIEAGGRSYEARRDYPVGHAEDPMSDERLEAKMADMAREHLAGDGIEALIDACYSVDDPDGPAALLERLTV